LSDVHRKVPSVTEFCFLRQSSHQSVMKSEPKRSVLRTTTKLQI
jgi:hypothetical protein